MMYMYNNGRLLLILLFVMLSLLTNACVGKNTFNFASASDDAGNSYPQIDNSFSSITGKIVLPDSDMPMAGISVYVPDLRSQSQLFINSPSLSSAGASKSDCAKPLVPHRSYTCTDGNGAFRLEIAQVDALPLQVVIQNQDLSLTTNITLNELNSDVGTIAFAEPQSLQKDKIAIVFDLLNPYEEINKTLAANDVNAQFVKIEMLQNFYEIYEIDTTQTEVDITTLKNLVQVNHSEPGGKLSDINQYNVIYINCRDESEIGNLDRQIKKALLNFVSNGGELFVTSWSFKFTEPDLGDYI